MDDVTAAKTTKKKNVNFILVEKGKVNLNSAPKA